MTSTSHYNGTDAYSTSTTTWHYWNVTEGSTADNSMTATSYVSGNNRVWYRWTDNYGTDTDINAGINSATYTQAWKTWTTVAVVDEKRSEETRKQAEERAERQAEAQRDADRRAAAERTRYQKLEKKREAAEIKAKDLLKDLIGEKELKIYEETGRLLVRGRKHDYIVPKDGFIKQIQKDKIVDLCVHLEEQNILPRTDNVIALALAIKTDEKKLIELANNHGEARKGFRYSLPRAACM